MERGNRLHDARENVARIMFAITAWVALLMMLNAGVASVARADDIEANEYEIKAAYLLNFPNFVDWPGGTSRGYAISHPFVFARRGPARQRPFADGCG